MLPSAHHECCNGNLAAAFQSLGQQAVNPSAVFAGLEVVGRLVIDRGDVGSVGEAGYIDGLGRFRIGMLEIGLGQRYILTFLVLITLDDVSPVNTLAGCLVDPLIPYGREIAAVEEMQIQTMFPGG